MHIFFLVVAFFSFFFFLVVTFFFPSYCNFFFLLVFLDLCFLRWGSGLFLFAFVLLFFPCFIFFLSLFFPIQVHIVHMNDAYPNVTEALKHNDGLAVLGFFFEVITFSLKALLH